MSFSDSRVPLLLDTDIGDDVDDVFALLLAARQPQVELMGVTTVYGDVNERTRIARKLLRLAGRTDVPVVTGLGTTLSGRDPGPVMSSGLGFATADEPVGTGANSGAVAFLIRRIRMSPVAPVLVAIGPLTNVGAALREAPDIVGRLRALILMGGRLGADAAKGEHNVNSDAAATQIVLESAAPLRIGTFEVTMRARLGRPAQDRLQRSGDPACMGAAAMLELYLHQTGRADTAMYDPLTLSLAYTDQFLTMHPTALRATYGPELVRLDAADSATSPVDVSVDAEPDAFIEHLLQTITGAMPAEQGS